MVTVAQAGELSRFGDRKIVEVEGRSIGIFNVKGTLVAVLNLCPHEFAPICRGKLGGTTLPSPPGEHRWGRDGEILSCPWHGWEFDLLTGKCLADRRRLRCYPVTIKGNDIMVTLGTDPVAPQSRLSGDGRFGVL